jgi:hypothetical protein
VLIEGTPVGFDAMAKPVQAGPCRLFIGVRSDPFFADGEGAFCDFQFTGDDTFAGKNILTIALEVPNDMLGSAFLHSCLHDVAEQAGRQLGQPGRPRAAR